MERIYYNKITGLLCNRYPTDIKIDENSAYIEVSEEIANTTYACPCGKHWAVIDNTLQQVDYETEESRQLKINDEIAKYLSTMKVKVHHFAWDNPKEHLEDRFKWLRPYLPQADQNIAVYVLTNYWSTIEEDLKRIYFLRDHGYQPYVMIYDKQKFVDSRGHWLPDVMEKYTKEQRVHFKYCQHLQRWCNNRMIFRTTLDFNDYLKDFWRDTKWTTL